MIIAHLVDGALAQNHDAILKHVKSAWLRGGSYRKARSALEHFDFLIDVLGAEELKKNDEARARLRKALIALREDIRKLMGSPNRPDDPGYEA
jgi:hypothetical protein